MLNNTPEEAEISPFRSKRYASLSDEDIVELSLTKLSDRDKIFLLNEIDHRGLADEAKRARHASIKEKASSSSWLKWVFILIGIVILIQRLKSYF